MGKGEPAGGLAPRGAGPRQVGRSCRSPVWGTLGGELWEKSRPGQSWVHPWPGAPILGARGRNFKPLRDRAQTPVAVKVGALDPEGWWYQGRSLCKGGSGCPQGGILGPMPDAWPGGLRTSSPRRDPPLDAPWSLSYPFLGASSLRSPAKHPWAEQTWC